jgi:hypothetical protein
MAPVPKVVSLAGDVRVCSGAFEWPKRPSLHPNAVFYQIESARGRQRRGSSFPISSEAINGQEPRIPLRASVWPVHLVTRARLALQPTAPTARRPPRLSHPHNPTTKAQTREYCCQYASRQHLAPSLEAEDAARAVQQP